jgi:hypothetical protein
VENSIFSQKKFHPFCMYIPVPQTVRKSVFPDFRTLFVGWRVPVLDHKTNAGSGFIYRAELQQVAGRAVGAGMGSC